MEDGPKVAKLVAVSQGALDLTVTDGRLQDWKSKAACAGFSNSYFFPGNDSDPAVAARAIEICATCPVREDCLQYAFETNQVSGIWGGTTEEERRSLRRKWLVTRRRTA